jgi:RNA polymerase sigma factor (sigma-70 family)
MTTTRAGLVLQHLRRLAGTSRAVQPPDAQLLERFCARGEEAAFAELVRRHGSMVLNVCRGVLRHEQDAEDAFQATFLVLARKAASIRRPEALAGFLYEVAHRVARRAQADAIRRRAREREAVPLAPTDPTLDMTLRELQGMLHEELRHLPDKYRLPLVLCYLEGRSQEEAAGQLGWSRGAFRGRLDRGRERLRRRLAARGVALSALLCATAVAPGEAAEELVCSVVRAVVPSAVGGAAGVLSARVSALAEGVGRAMFLSKTKIATVVFLAIGLLAAGAGVLRHQIFAAQAAQESPAPSAAKAAPVPPAAAKPPAADDKDVLAYAGRVQDVDGKPLAGATVLISGLNPGVIEFRARAVSGADGKFRFSVRRDEFGDKGVVPAGRSPPERFVFVAATADGHGAACVSAGRPEERPNLVLWLPAEEIVRGRVLGLEGKGVAGVSVSAMILSARSAGDHRPLPYDAPAEAGSFSGNVLPWENTSAETDREGRFVLRGLSRGWLYDLTIHGPTLVNAKARLAARPQKADVVKASGMYMPGRPDPQIPLYGSTFTHVAAPCRPIVGVVRERGSGKPLAGITVRTPYTRDDDPQAAAVTDKDGRYRLTGLPSGPRTLWVEPPTNVPYLAAEVRVNAGEPGLAPVTLDVSLPRQPTVRGQVTDGATGKPVAAWVEYRPLAGNPSLKANPKLAEPQWGNHPPGTRTDRDGRFSLPVLAGPGVLLVHAEGGYLPARLSAADRGGEGIDKTDPELIDCRPLPAWPGDFHAYRLIDGREGKDASLDLTLTPGVSRPLVVEFPGGKARDVTVLGLEPVANDHGGPYHPGKSRVVGLAEGEVRRLFLSSSDAEFAATSTVSGKEVGPVAVKLKPTGTITGRVVDRDGKPIASVWFQTFFDDGPGRPGVFVHGGYTARAPTEAESQRGWRTKGYLDKGVKASRGERTDAQGRFRLTGVVPDTAFDLVAQLVGPPNAKGQQFTTGEVRIARPTVRPGQTLDLGDLRAAAPEK